MQSILVTNNQTFISIPDSFCAENSLFFGNYCVQIANATSVERYCFQHNSYGSLTLTDTEISINAEVSGKLSVLL